MTEINHHMHYLEPDYRFDSQISTIKTLDGLLGRFKRRMKPINWYDALWFLEDAEMIYGLGYISLQNYINKSLKDYCNAYKLKYAKSGFYKTGRLIDGYDYTNIELVISLANYAKHEHESISGETLTTLKAFGLIANSDYDNDFEAKDSPIYKGLELFTTKYRLMPIFKEVKEWRDKLWKEKIQLETFNK